MAVSNIDSTQALELPLEIHFMILNSIADDKSSLAACALVCRAWRPVARTHHFKSLCLPRKANLSARLLLTDSTSSILPFIRHLSIKEDYYGALWVADFLHHMRLNELVQLESLTLDRLLWIDYDPQTKAKLLLLLARVKELRLLSVYTSTALDAIELLVAAPSLQRLIIADHTDHLSQRDFTTDDIRARFPAVHISHALTHLETNEPQLLVAIHSLAPQPPITTLVVNETGVPNIAILAAFLRASGSTLKHLTVRFIRSEGASPTPLSAYCCPLTFILSIALRPVDEFISLHGLKHNPSLRSVTLHTRRFSMCGPILEQLASPHICLVCIELTPYALVFGHGEFDLHQLGALFMRPPLALATLRLVVKEEDLEVLVRLRETARERLGALLEEKRLEFWSPSAGAETEALLDEYEASANERDPPFSFPWPPLDPHPVG